MEFSYRFKSSCNNVFSKERRLLNPDSYRVYDLSNHQLFNYELLIKLNAKCMEIPSLGSYHTENAILSSILLAASEEKEIQLRDTVIPLYVGSSQNRRTFDGMWYIGCHEAHFGNRLIKFTTQKGEEFYIGKGIVLDSNFKPLFLASLILEQIKELNTRPAECFLYTKALIRISPSVFQHQDTMINKNIIKKLIPYYSSAELYYSSNYFSTSRIEYKAPDVVVSNFDDMIISPVKPKSVDNIQESLNDCLVNNIGDITNLWV